MPAYNYARFIERAIESALGQSYPSEAVEILVVDDGSTDGTPEAVRPYLDRVRYIRKENGGINSAVNVALAEATGDYIAFLDADDVWPREKTARQVGFLEDHPEVGLLYADMEVIGADDELVRPSFFEAVGLQPLRGRVLAPLLSRNFVSGGAIMMRSSLAPVYFPLPAEAAWTDWWFAFRIAQVAELDFLPDPLYRYRLHGENTLFGARGERLTRLLRDKELPWRRWMLSHVGPQEASASDFLLGWSALEETLFRVARETDTPPVDLLAVTDEQRELATEAVDRAREALQERHLDAVACHLVRALAHNPFDHAARQRLSALVRFLSQAAEHAAGERPAAADPTVPTLQGERGFATLAFADELLAHPELLVAYGEAFGAGDDATLVIYAPDWRPEDVERRLGPAIERAGLGDESGPDLLAFPCALKPSVEGRLAQRVSAVFSRRTPPRSFAGVARFDETELADLRDLAELRWSAIGAA